MPLSMLNCNLEREWFGSTETVFLRKVGMAIVKKILEDTYNCDYCFRIYALHAGYPTEYIGELIEAYENCLMMDGIRSLYSETDAASWLTTLTRR